MDRGSEGRRATKLSALDLELWSAVTADVKPFRARPVTPKPVLPPSARNAINVEGRVAERVTGSAVVRDDVCLGVGGP